MQIKTIQFSQLGDERGMLVSLEELKNIPFDIKRVYYLYETKTNVRRGFHAHRELRQVLICVHGSCKILLDNGCEKETVLLDKPDFGLVIEADIWREMFDFSDGAVLLVLASELYDESDYIRNYDDFLKYLEEKR